MPFYHNLLLPLFLCTVVAFGTFLPSFSSAAQADTSNYELSLSFNVKKHIIIGTAKITIKQGEKLTLTLPGLNLTGTLLKTQDGNEYEIQPSGDIFTLPASDSSQILFLSYTKKIEGSYTNSVNANGISLTGGWYPLPHTPKIYRLTATLPENFSAITESDSFPLTQHANTVVSTFARPVTEIHFVAGPYIIQKQNVRPGLSVYSMFFKEDKKLAAGYLNAAVTYLNHYENEFGPYPFHHYVIVDNRLPTGFGMPTFTLLGQAVIRLPFIKNTSLGHEIVHSWFGNGVGVDYSHGNWCEGLTTFLADSSFREDKGEGVANRKESITRYLSYVHGPSALPLADFMSASHLQPMAKARRAVGYNRGSLFFHELRNKIGRTSFKNGLRLFYTRYNGVDASWVDLRKSFETAAHTDLGKFFSERLNRSYIPAIAIKNITITPVDGKPTLSFLLIQKSVKPFSLSVPIWIKTMFGTKKIKRDVTKTSTLITVPLDSRPLEIVLDPEYDFLRLLSYKEFPAVWSRFLGAEKKLVILSSEKERPLYAPLLQSLDQTGLTVTTSDAVTNKELSENSLLFLGTDQKACRSLFGPPSAKIKGIKLDVRHNPLNRNQVAVLFSSEKNSVTQAIVSRLSHYGKYSLLEFHNNKIVKKIINHSESGIHIILEKLPKGGATTNLTSFQNILNKLEESSVVYVGENHTSLADHRLQLRIIEGLFKQNQKLAIGMEMFPVSSQTALDKYTRSDGSVTEATFLKDSDYFNVWRYDYRFFRDILNFARTNHIAVIGLNLDRKIVSKVFRTGNTDTLAKEIRNTLPLDRNLDMSGYTERLSQMNTIHVQGKHGSGKESGFIQAQALWDETMAKNISSYLRDNPGYKMVVLAGSQHTRKDSGIPPRVKERLDVKQTSVLNIYNDFAPTDLDTVADYFFLATPVSLPRTPIIGIVLASESDGNKKTLKIKQISPHSNAKDAGLRSGDILMKINSSPISTMADLRIAMLGAKAGETVSVTVKRKENDKDQEIKFMVKLTLPSTSQMLP